MNIEIFRFDEKVNVCGQFIAIFSFLVKALVKDSAGWCVALFSPLLIAVAFTRLNAADAPVTTNETNRSIVIKAS